MRTIGVAERRARLGIRHLLAPAARAGEVADVARGLVALHGTDPASVYLAVAARTKDGAPTDVEAALYEDRTLLRMLGMRRTVFAVHRDLVAVVQSACTRAIAAQQRTRLLALLASAGIPDPEPWLRDTEDATLRALAESGPGTGAELAKRVPALRTTVVVAPGSRNEARQNVSSRVLLVLGAEGRIVRGRPRGSWISTQFQWSPVEDWLPGGIPDLPVGDAQAELARHWLARFGPGTLADLRWWTGWTAAQAKKALARIDAVEVDLDGTPGLILAEDEDPVAEAEPWAALLPGPRSDTDGVDRARLVPRRARAGVVRPDRQHRAKYLVERANRRRLGPARGWRGRHPTAGEARPRGRAFHPDGGREPAALARRRPGHSPVPHPAGTRADDLIRAVHTRHAVTRRRGEPHTAHPTTSIAI